MNELMNKPIKILMLNYEYPPLGGGAGNATQYLLNEFANRSDLNVVLVTSSESAFHQEKLAGNIKIYYLDIGKSGSLHYQSCSDLLKYTYKAWMFCLRYMKENHVDLIHAFFGIPCGFIALILGKPYLVSLRGSDVPFYNERFYWLDKLVFQHLSKIVWKKAKRVIANSEGLKQLALEILSDQEIEVIYNGVDTGEFYPKIDKKRGEKIRLISVGRLIERKGYTYLIEALKGIENVQLILIGDGDRKEQLQILAKENEVDVKFLGRIEHENLPGFLRKSDLFILPSLNEGMSNAILEAMACGLPIIATDTGGSKELVQGNGCIVPTGDVEALRKAVIKYTENADLIKAEGDKSRLLAEGMSWKKAANCYYAKYKNTAKGFKEKNEKTSYV